MLQRASMRRRRYNISLLKHKIRSFRYRRIGRYDVVGTAKVISF